MPFQETEKSIYHYYQILIKNAHSSSFYHLFSKYGEKRGKF